MRLLVVEDHEPLGRSIAEQLAADGHAVDWVRTLGEARSNLATTAYDQVLLDLLLPDGRGLDLLRCLRRQEDTTPVIILTALDQITDRIAGLNAGADDYLVKPFDLDELSARVSAIARRYAARPNPRVSLGALEIDLAERELRRDGRVVDLTVREWALLEALLRRPGATLSKSRLEDGLYAFGAEIESNGIEAHVSRLRKKIGREAILTVRGMGYRIALPHAS